MDANELINILETSGLAESENAVEKLNSGALFKIEEALAKAGIDLRATFQARLNILENKQTLYAKRLAESVSEFVSNLDSNNPEWLRTITIPAEDNGNYLLWVIPQSNKVIGCMYTLSAEHRANEYT